MDELINLLYKWQALTGAVLGGGFALSVALLVSYKTQRREEIAAGYLITGNLTSFTASTSNLNLKAEEGSITDKDYPLWLCNNLMGLKPTLSTLYETSVSRVISKDVRLGVHLDLIRTFNADIDAAFVRINNDYEYHDEHGKNKRSEERIRADANLVARGYNNIAVHAECANYLIPRLVTSHFPSWYLFLSYFFPNEMDKKSKKLILTGKA